MSGLLSVVCLLEHPVQPQALCWAADHAGDGGAAGDLNMGKETKIGIKFTTNNEFQDYLCESCVFESLPVQLSLTSMLGGFLSSF